MTRFIFSTLFFIPLAVIGQIRFDTAQIRLRHNFQTQPTYFLDSVSIDISKTYFDVTNIAAIKVTSDTFYSDGLLKYGKVNIASKNKNYNWATLSDFKVKKTDTDTTQPRLYIIDGNLISDTTNVRIEKTYIKSIDIVNMADTKGIYYDGKAKIIFLITTKQRHKKHRTKNSH